MRGREIIFPLLNAAALTLRKLKKTEQGRRVWDRIKLHLPMKIGCSR